MKEMHLVDAHEHVHIYTPLAKASLAKLDLATVLYVLSCLFSHKGSSPGRY